MISILTTHHFQIKNTIFFRFEKYSCLSLIIFIMSLLSFIIFLLHLYLLTAINQTCSFIEPCPNRAECSPSTNYCVCQPGFIANCNIEADPIGQYPQIVELAPNDFRLFYMSPIQINQFIEFTITICRQKGKANVPIMLSMWTQKGSNSQYLPTNTISHPTQMSFDSQCNTLTIKFAVFDEQPNGQKQLLIIGVGDNKDFTTLTLSAAQKLILGVNFYYYIMVGVVVFASVLSLISAVLFMLRRSRRRGLFGIGGYIIDNTTNLDHFQAFMPSILAEQHNDTQPCPICLQSFQVKEEIRHTPCNHTFHTLCLDSWCITNLNCPVCRSDFSIQKIALIKDSLSKKEVLKESKNEKLEGNIQENIEIQMQKCQTTGRELKQQMIQ